MFNRKFIRQIDRWDYLPILLNKIKYNIPRQICLYEIIVYLKILIINICLPQTFIEKLIIVIDKFIGTKVNDPKIQLQIYQYAYQCLDQLGKFKNIPNLKILKSVNFWKYTQKVIRIVYQQQMIQFMHQLWFIDFGSIIWVLIFKQQLQLLAQHEYSTLLRFRELYFMTD
ncbi:hypothetical protein pb186bvf_001765 [Paramecium bursaria]